MAGGYTKLGNKIGGGGGGNQNPFEGDSYDWLEGFTASAFSSLPELVGIKPATEVEEWRQKNPAAAFLGSMGMTAIPYAGWFAATKKIKLLDDAINSIGNLEKAPFLSGAAREVARFAPFEASRVIASQFLSDEDLGSMAGSAAINLAIGGGLGGVLEGIASAGTRRYPLAQLAPGIDIASPNQIQQRFIQDLINKGPAPENLPQLQYHLKELRNLSRQEFLPVGTRYVTRLEGDLSGRASDGINRMFRSDLQGTGFKRRRFVTGQSDFSSSEEWAEIAKRAGLPSNFEDLGQYYRHVSYSGSKAPSLAKVYDKGVTNNLDSIGNGWFLGREADDGLFVMARKIAGKPGKPDVSDEWVLFKTDTPGSFAPQPQKWANSIMAKNAWVPQAVEAADGGPIYNALTNFSKQFPFLNYRVLLADKEGIAKAIDKLMPKKFGKRSNELIERMRDATKEYLAPARMQFTKSPRANWIHTAAKAVYDAAETEGQRLLYGELRLDPNKSLFWSAIRGQQQPTNATALAAKTMIDSLNDKEVEELWKVWRAKADESALADMHNRGLISSKTYKAAQRLNEIDSEVWEGMNKARLATGEREISKEEGYYGLSRSWLGDSRIVLRGEDGKVVGIASGVNRRAAQGAAKKLQTALENEGQVARVAEEFEVSQVDRIPSDVRPIVRTPGFVLERGGVRGFRWDLEPFTREELMEGLEGSVRGKLKYEANISVLDKFSKDLDKLNREDPFAYRLLTARLNDLAGVQGPLGLVQNQIVDKILAPVLGNQSATKIVGVTNSMMWHLQLGAGKMSYPILNALTFLQTVLPEVAYITSAAPEHLAGKYTYFAAGGTRGPVGVLGVLNPLTLMRDSLREMRRPSQELLQAFERATNERVIDPRLVEEYIGESATKLTDIRGAIKGPGQFVDWLKALSEFLPAQSERLSRGHAFTVGHLVAKNILGMKNAEHAYRFARQFTEHTMYLYTAADRPRMFTTPAGSFFGLFKNWMANYTASLLEYAGEGVVRNNWSPLLWQTAGTLGVGGLAATPLYFVADGFTKAFTNKSILELTYDGFNEDNDWMADSMLFGLPAGLTGVSLYSQTASPISNPIRDVNMLFSTAHLDRLQYMSKAMGAAWDSWQATGQHPGKDPRVLEQMVRAFAPVTLYRILGAAQDGAIKSLSSGYPMQTNVGLMDRLFYMAGFNSTEMDKSYAVSEILFAKKAQMLAEVQRLGQAFAEYQMSRDSAGMKSILRQAYSHGVDPSSVLRSAQSRVQKMTTPMLERNFKPEDLARFEKVLGGSD